MSHTLTTTIVAAILTASVAATHAAPVTIPNASFESPGLFVTPDNWTKRSGTTFDTHPDGGGLVSPDGVQQAFIGNGGDGEGYSDNLAHALLANTEYTLSGYVGWRDDDPNPTTAVRSGTIQLVQGGSGAAGTGTVLISLNKTFVDGSDSLGTYYFLTGSFTTGAVVSADPLRAEILSDVDGGIQTWFDALALDAVSTIPAPAALPAGLAIFGVIVARRRLK